MSKCQSYDSVKLAYMGLHRMTMGEMGDLNCQDDSLRPAMDDGMNKQ